MMVAFDLDGTLVDSATDIATSANELVTARGGEPIELDAISLMVGDGAGVLVTRALHAAGLPTDSPGALQQFLDIYARRLLESTIEYPGMRATLALLAPRVRMVVLTNKPLAHSERVLAGLGLREFFSEVIGGDDPRGRKPDPSTLLAVIGSEPGGAVYVGDSPVDWLTAQNAGTAFAWARYGFGARRFADRPPDTPYVLDAPRDLVAVVDRIATVASGM
jgi:phosphoglycolate phosphatase